MKTSLSTKFTLAFTLTGALMLTGNVHAARTSLHGSVCTNYFANETGNFSHSVTGTVNSTPTESYTLCPLVVTHDPAATAGTVFVQYSTPVAFTCTAFTYDSLGRYVGALNATARPGNGSLVFPSIPAASTTNHSVLCKLPQNAYIQSIEAIF